MLFVNIIYAAGYRYYHLRNKYTSPIKAELIY